MTSLLEKGLRRYQTVLPEAAAVDVEIRTPADEAIEHINAAPARRDFQQYVVGDAAGTAEVFDWIVAEPDLVFPIAGKQQPATGWEIRYTKDDGSILVFVCRPESGTREFDVVDPLGLLYRIHTKFDRTETP